MAKPKFEYTIKQIYEDTYLIDEHYSSMFLLVGSERALVIDCGTGVADFKSIIEGVTDKPYDVAMTHSHVDHIGGRGQFDTIYVSEKDAEFIKSVTVFQRKGYSVISRFSLGAKYSGLNIRKVEVEPTVRILREGDLLQLGGRSVAVYETAGHTVGSLSFLDVENRTIFIGDVANEFLLMALPHCTSLEEMIATHDKLLAMDSYDTVWSSHHLQPQTKEDIALYRRGAQQVMERKKRNSPIPFIKIHTIDGAKLVYRTNNVYTKSSKKE